MDTILPVQYRELFAQYPLAFSIAGIILIAVLTKRLRQGAGTAKDPVRLYTTQERRQRFSQAGNRCEMDGWIFFLRCSRPAEHGDHFLPWAKGGATSQKNFVSACAKCNRRKGAKLPSWGAGQRIAWRRRKYFPKHSDRAPGQRYR